MEAPFAALMGGTQISVKNTFIHLGAPLTVPSDSDQSLRRCSSAPALPSLASGRNSVRPSDDPVFAKESPDEGASVSTEDGGSDHDPADSGSGGSVLAFTPPSSPEFSFVHPGFGFEVVPLHLLPAAEPCAPTGTVALKSSAP